MEFGVFHGLSLARFAMFRKLLNNESRKIVAFDTFDDYPETEFDEDKELRAKFIAETGGKSISIGDMLEILGHKECDSNLSIIAGDICDTLPQYINLHPNLEVSLVNLDVDIYEPSKVVIENIWPRIVKGGILMLDNYRIFNEETKAVDDYFRDKSVMIRWSSFSSFPAYIVKE
jgi:hypothetical protein